MEGVMQIIIARPEFKKVAEDIECFCMRCNVGDEMLERKHAVRLVSTQM
jgi:hypothetical protein